MKVKSVVEPMQGSLPRRSFVTRAGLVGLSAAAAAFLPGTPVRAQFGDRDDRDNLSGDTAQEIFAAALIAEDLASTFCYNGLVGPVIMDPNLAGLGGTATNVTSAGNLGNVDYFRAALSEEITHANLLRSLIGKTLRAPILSRRSISDLNVRYAWSFHRDSGRSGECVYRRLSASYDRVCADGCGHEGI